MYLNSDGERKKKQASDGFNSDGGLLDKMFYLVSLYLGLLDSLFTTGTDVVEELQMLKCVFQNFNLFVTFPVSIR